jgi:REP element-mobilizing transposase RayT
VYFVTICSIDKGNVFGEILNGSVYSNIYGEIVRKYWIWLERQYPYVKLDTWILMPDHLHGIINIIKQNDMCDCRGGSRTAPTPGIVKPKPLGRIIGAFKTVSTKHINDLHKTNELQLWQRGYYDRIIRNDGELYAIRRYIIDNPLHWKK